MIRLSQSSTTTYLKCPAMFEYAYVKRLEKRVFNINFFVGNLIHEGMHLTYLQKDDMFSELGKKIDQAIEELRDSTLLSPEEEQKLGEWKVIILGMIYAYNLKNGGFIGKHKHLHNEKELIIPLVDGVEFVIKIDNVLANQEKEFIHEIKTTRELNDNYVNAIKYSFQVASYFHLAKMSGIFNPQGIIYDVLQKPSIRLKKNESYEQYLIRLEEYYQLEPDKRLWTEIIEEPAIKKDELLSTILSVAGGIKEKRFYKSYQSCAICDYSKLCYGNDAPELMMAYQKKEDTTSGTITDGEV